MNFRCTSSSDRPRRPGRRPGRRRLSVALVTGMALVGAMTGCSADPASSSTASAPVTTPSAPSTTTGQSQAYPVTVTSCGRPFTYDKAPSRVVLGYPRSLETLDALGVGGSVYGYTLGGYDARPADYPAGVVEVSPDYAPSREAMIAARPDLYLANDDSQAAGEGTVSHADLAAIGSGIYVLGQYCSNGDSPTSLQAIYDDVHALGRIYGIPDRARAVTADLQRRVAAAAARNPGPALRVGFLQVYDGRIYANGGYPASGIISALGLTNEFADLSGSFTEITPEEALVRTPDVLFVNYVGADQQQAAIDEIRAALPATPAVRHNRVYGFDETNFQAGGVTIISALESVADQLFG